ncbi:MAG: hypothetical protein KKE50_01165 [Nanoarchaeota archaeon]|nr:hypothetical protein [Nanoarchaeota archaeon]
MAIKIILMIMVNGVGCYRGWRFIEEILRHINPLTSAGINYNYLLS